MPELWHSGEDAESTFIPKGIEITMTLDQWRDWCNFRKRRFKALAEKARVPDDIETNGDTRDSRAFPILSCESFAYRTGTPASRHSPCP
ncbi:hypothetical protein PM082_015708 [Marasmius tenuissimus]|nr:hypothetical protein PM082_015708 [Marasmius tenuissimus]